MTPSTEVDGTTTAQTAMTAEEQQILHRIDRGVRTSEEELRYQLERKDRHPLARDERLIDVLAELEERGLIASMLCFELTDRGRAELHTAGRPLTALEGKLRERTLPSAGIRLTCVDPRPAVQTEGAIGGAIPPVEPNLG